MALFLIKESNLGLNLEEDLGGQGRPEPCILCMGHDSPGCILRILSEEFVKAGVKVQLGGCTVRKCEKTSFHHIPTYVVMHIIKYHKS
jgi:hypothetical protein